MAEEYPRARRTTRPNREVRKALVQHARWLKTNGQIGKRIRINDAIGIKFTGAILRRANLSGTALMWANFVRADLSGANLRGTDLSWARLLGANLECADLRETVLCGTVLAGANLRHARMDDTQAYGTDFSGAIVNGATLYGARLDAFELDERGIDRYVARLYVRALQFLDYPLRTTISQSQLDVMCGDSRTILPRGLRVQLSKGRGRRATRPPN
jgi:uncharacterized protein YjbI with pentapeptide repeats